MEGGEEGEEGEKEGREIQSALYASMSNYIGHIYPASLAIAHLGTDLSFEYNPNKINELVLLCTAAAAVCSVTFFTSTSTANCSAICQGRMLIFSPK